MSFYVFEACNMFVGDDGPDNSKHLQIDTIKLPVLEENSQDHFAGGAIGEISVGNLGLKKLEITFKLKGFDPQVMSQFGLNGRNSLPYTIYGAIRDKKGGAPVEMKCVARGRLGKIESDELKRGDLIGHDHMIHEILHYEMWFANKEKYYYDWFASDWRVDGISANAEIRNILRIPGAA
jgi:P2 family phage contractile tail tube protein